MSKIPVSFEGLPNMAPFDILLAMLECPWLWNVCPSPKSQLLWIVQNLQTLPTRFSASISCSIPLTTIIGRLVSCCWDGLPWCWMHVLSCCQTCLHNFYPRATSPKLKKNNALFQNSPKLQVQNVLQNVL